MENRNDLRFIQILTGDLTGVYFHWFITLRLTNRVR